MPKYTDRVYADANPIRHLLKGKDVKMSGVLWELGLRNNLENKPQTAVPTRKRV